MPRVKRVIELVSSFGNIGKRGKFVITTFIIPLGFLVLQFLTDNQYRLVSIGLLSVVTLLLFYWSLKEGLGLDATLLVMILPFFYTLGAGLFWFLIPTTLFARIPVIILFGLGIYALCLSSNIFTVAAIRTIALSRAAKGVSFVINLLTSFLIFDAILSLRGNIFMNMVLVVIVSFPIFLQALWASVLDKKLPLEIITLSSVFAFILMQVATMIYFWPVTVVVGSIFLTVTFYMLAGLGQAYIEGRLFKSTVGEYLTVGVFVFLAMLFATPWRG